MPGRHKASGGVEPKLTRQQANLAGRVLKALWTAEQGAPSDEEKSRFHAEINAAFAEAGHAAHYSERKLADAISNRMYTWRLAQRNKVPQSWAAGARANRRKRTMEEVTQNNRAEVQSNQTKEEGMVTPRGTASLVDGYACDVETFGLPLPLVQDDFACTVEAPALPADLDLQVSSVSTTVDDSWNVFATLDSTDLLPSPPSSPMASPTPQDASMCGTDMTYDVASDCTCGAAPPLDDLDLLLDRAHVDINLDGIELCDVEFASVDQPQSESAPETDSGPETAHKSDDKRSVAGYRSAGMPMIGFENKTENSWVVPDSFTQSRTQSSSEPQQKVRKMDPHQPFRDPASKERKGHQTLLDAQMAMFERFESSTNPFDPTPLQPRVDPQRQALRTLNPQRQPATAA